jgi:hypothetical protein
MSQHSMRRGSVGQAQSLLDLGEAHLDVLRGSLLRREGVAGVVARHVAEVLAWPALRNEQLHLSTTPSLEPLGHARGAIGQHRQQHLGRQRPALAILGVELAEEVAEHLLVGHLDPAQRVAHRVGHAPRAHEEHRDLDDAALAVEADDVLIDVAHRDDALRLAHRLDRAQLVAVDGRALELHRSARVPHQLFELARELVVPALEEERHRAHLRVVAPRSTS